MAAKFHEEGSLFGKTFAVMHSDKKTRKTTSYLFYMDADAQKYIRNTHLPTFCLLSKDQVYVDVDVVQGRKVTQEDREAGEGSLRLPLDGWIPFDRKISI